MIQQWFLIQLILLNLQIITKTTVLVLGGKDWHSGVIGIAASKLSDRYSKPVIMVGIEDSIARGSAFLW